MEELMVIRILLIDDEEALLEIAKTYLGGEKGFKVDTALSAQEALGKLERGRFDVIVSDYWMPGMNGIELLKKLKSAGDTTPFILFTGRGREDVAIDALNNGASFYLQKGGDPKSQFAELVNVIETSVRQARAEKTLREEKDRAQQYINLAGIMLLALDKHGNVTLINKKGCEILGYEENQILGKSWFESFLPESRRDEVKAIFNRLMRGELGPLEHQPPFPVLCGDGVERRIAFTNALLKDEKGEIVGTLSSGEDVAEREQTENALKKSEMKYRKLVELAREGIWTIDADANTTYVNPRMAEMLGYTSEEMIGRPIFSFTDERGKEIAQIGLDRQQQGTREQHDFEFLRKDGQRLYASLQTTLLMDEAGNNAGALAVVADITERKRAEEALKKSEAKFAIAFNSSPEMMVIGSLKEGRLVDVNSAFLQLTGHTREAVLGRTVTEIGMIGEAERNRLRSLVEEKGTVQGLEVHDRTKGGADRDTLVSAAAISVEDEPCMLVIISDVTDRKRAEEALRASEARFQSFMSHIPAVAYMMDASDRYLYINKTYEDAFDLKGSDVVGKTVEEIWPAATAAAFRKTDQQILASNEGIELIEVVPQKGGPREFLTFKFPVPDARGASNVLGGVSIDITERRRVEKALMQANKKLNLLGDVTRHDAINQLSVLFAWLEIAKEVARDEPIHEHLARVSEAAKVIQRQLEFTADYQEVGVKQPEWMDLADAVNRGIEGVDKGKVSLDIDLVGIQVFADPMLEKVFHNLVENALRHGEKVKSISISARETREGLTIVCEDDGGGIPADDKERVFLRGFGKNTGFGLYMVREVLGITGIQIMETGVPGKGARFEIAVPSGNYKVSRQ
jgi:PAS domain S-box-containing protein